MLNSEATSKLLALFFSPSPASTLFFTISAVCAYPLAILTLAALLPVVPQMHLKVQKWSVAGCLSA